jgi:hypothetical protein
MHQANRADASVERVVDFIHDEVHIAETMQNVHEC